MVRLFPSFHWHKMFEGSGNYEPNKIILVQDSVPERWAKRPKLTRKRTFLCLSLRKFGLIYLCCKLIFICKVLLHTQWRRCCCWLTTPYQSRVFIYQLRYFPTNYVIVWFTLGWFKFRGISRETSNHFIRKKSTCKFSSPHALARRTRKKREQLH